MNRKLYLLLGLLALAGFWLGPLPGLAARGSFSAHMALHMGVVAVASALLALGLAGTRWDPVRRLPWAFAPVPLSILELIIVWAWHTPGLHRFARETLPGLALEQGSFLAAGLALWLACFGGGAHLRAERLGAGVAGMLLTSMHMTFLGALLALANRPLYPHGHGHGHGDHHHGPMPAVGGLSPLDDQHLGGAIMIVLGCASYLIGGLWLTAQLLRSRATPELKEVRS